MAIPFEDFGGSGPILHFAHANGYHPGAYRQLITEFLPHYQVVGMHFRPLWKGCRPRSAPSWKTHARDLVNFLDAQGKSDIIGMGHSLGAVATVLAASQRPDLFSRLVLLDPVLLPPANYRTQTFTPIFLRRLFIPPAKVSAKRKDSWPSKKEAYDYLRPKRVFRRIPDLVFRDFIEHAIDQEPAAGEAKLTYSRDWETHIYSTASNPWRAIRKLDCPVLVIRGEDSNVLLPDVLALLKASLPTVVLEDIAEAGHLVPLELPQLTAQKAMQFLAS